MDIQGKIIAVCDLKQGVSQSNGNEWKSQDYVLETHEQYPKKICFNVFGEKVDTFAIKVGEELTVSFDIDAREYNGRWYNTIRAWKVSRQGETQQSQPQPQVQRESQPLPEPLQTFVESIGATQNEGEALPF